jgi:hypothetical protein
VLVSNVNSVADSAAVALTIGAWGTGAYYINAQIDDVRIYNRALTVDEITLQYNKTKNKYQ